MGLALGQAWELRLREQRAYVHRRVDEQPMAALLGVEALILGLMDGSRTRAEIEEVLVAAGRPTAVAAVGALIGRLGPLLVDDLRRPIRRPIPYELEALAGVDPPDPAEGLRPLPGPRVLHWWVTSACPRRCVYCFADPKHSDRAEDAELTRDELRGIFSEAATLGARSLLVAGAEPFLRRDLPEVMGDATQRGITPLVTTKHPIDRDLAERLAAARIRHISLSVDSMSEAESAVLIGSSAYPGQVRRSVESLRAAGLAFSIQAVVTAHNRRSVAGVAAFAAAAGARVLQVVPYEPVRRPIASFSNEDLLVEDAAALEGEVARLDEEWAELEVELFEELGSGSRDDYHCDVGMTKLFFLPNGVVHRCYKLIRDERLTGKDLRGVSLAACWHDPGFLEVISPPSESYAGSACDGCGSFSNCHSDGRCIYQAHVDHGLYQAPDRSCDGPFPIVREPVAPSR